MLDLKPITLFLIFGILIISRFAAIGQENQQWEEREGDIEDAEVVIEKSLDIELPPANRKFEKIPPLPLQAGEPAQPFTFKNLEPSLKKLDPEIRVLKVSKDSLPRFYGNYVKAGFGNYATPVLEGYFNNRRNENYTYGLHLIHHSSGRGPVDDANSGTSYNNLGFDTKFFAGGHTIGIEGDYERQKNYFYGYDPQLEVRKDTIRQLFNIFILKGNIANQPEAPEAFRYDVGASFERLADDYNATENQFGLNLNLGAGLGENAEITVRGDLFLTEREDLLNDEFQKQERNFFRLSPSLSYLMDDLGLKLRGGFHTVYEDDTLDNAGFLHIYPFFSLDYQLADGLNLSGQVDGNVERTSLLQFVRKNPFLGPNIPLFHTNNTFGLEGSLTANVMHNLVLKGGLSFDTYKNLFFFNNSASDSTRFTIQYEQEETTLFTFFGELSFDFNEEFRSVLKAKYYNYEMATLEEPWHKPQYELNFIGRYNIYDKIRLNADLQVLGGIKGKNRASGNVVSLNTIADLGIGGEYLFSKQFSAFLNFENIFGQNYQRYLNYPSRGLMIKGGITYSF